MCDWSSVVCSSDLPEVLAWLSRRYGLQLEVRGVQLRVQAPAQCRPVAIDQLVLRQVAENLVNNAMKYAPGSDIEISVRSSAPGFWQLLVEDRGPGIPAQQQRKLFKPFTRLGQVDPDGGLSSGRGTQWGGQCGGNT